jgi:TetR/AcrR family transcriptional repressor of nem operon
MPQPSAETRTRLLDAALKVIRTKGYNATRVDDICDEAGLSKGSFFHHFASKEAFAVAAAAHWSEMTGGLFAGAPYHAPEDPLDRVLAYIDFRKALVRGEVPEFTCLVGTMVQEAYHSNPDIRDACERSISGHARTLVADIAAAKRKYAPTAPWSAEGLALHTQAVIQGAFILAKARDDASIATDSIDHLRHYFELLFQRPRAHHPRSQHPRDAKPHRKEKP